jgi:hypothetical protein
MGCLELIRVSRIPNGTLELELLNHCICHRTSYLAAILLEEDRPLQICHSPAGFYIGCTLPTGEPLSRDSQEYWQEEAHAARALEERNWTQRMDA